jgi:methylated-DNA-[protein]-cysteine S-methyltransferase
MAILGTIKTPIGLLAIKTDQGELTGVDILPGNCRKVPRINSQSLATDVKQQLSQYFSDGNFQFHLPLNIQGTDFQKKVWKIMTRIPAGKVMTYGAVAKKLSSSPRAVGNACRANPMPIIIPCHRVVSQTGLGGYEGQTSGERLSIKSWLLQHEGVALE